jgi:hypothetical protein
MAGCRASCNTPGKVEEDRLIRVANRSPATASKPPPPRWLIMPLRCYPCPRTPITHVPRTTLALWARGNDEVDYRKAGQTSETFWRGMSKLRSSSLLRQSPPGGGARGSTAGAS